MLGAVQVVAMAMRVGAGRWSDTMATRTVPLARIGIAMSVALAVATVLLSAPLFLLIPAFVVAGRWRWRGTASRSRLSPSWRAEPEAAGTGVQQTPLSVGGVGAPLAFAAVVSASSWSLAYALAAVFPLAGWLVLRALREPEVAQPQRPR